MLELSNIKRLGNTLTTRFVQADWRKVRLDNGLLAASRLRFTVSVRSTSMTGASICLLAMGNIGEGCLKSRMPVLRSSCGSMRSLC